MMDYSVFLDPDSQGIAFVASRFVVVSFLYVLDAVSNRRPAKS